MPQTHVQKSESLHAPLVKLEKRALMAGALQHCFAGSFDRVLLKVYADIQYLELQMISVSFVGNFTIILYIKKLI